MLYFYQGVYNCKNHPKYRNGEWTEEDVFKDFLSTFEVRGDGDGVVSLLGMVFVHKFVCLSVSIVAVLRA